LRDVRSSEDDPEGSQGAGVLAQGGEVDRPGSGERADGEIAQAGHDLRADPGAQLGASSAKVTSRM
jgi:hypothetical protein